MKRSLLLSVLAFVFLFSSVIVSQGAGKGALTVTTYPVPGNVKVDGKDIGKAPVTIVLDEGGHEISFLDYSSQYTTPPVQKIIIKADDKIRITGMYTNRFVPREPPKSFFPADSLFVYGMKDRPRKDGTIYDYIDGGAIVYLRHGFRETTHAAYRRPGGSTLTLDIYDMGTPAGARAGFDDEEICPSGFGQSEIGAPCKTYHYEPDYFLYFHKSSYLVYVSTNNDSLKTSVETFAAIVSRNIK
ncbi:MAG: PEGA domain-containing protein [Candidatus Latescibacter sp.]|nr:PEGA domain-containing protein [Candidatus Latescibacter sp.]